ncbi:MAG: efflux RND transporter periplasmic adaptor subunit [Hymenobacter sp.]
MLKAYVRDKPPAGKAAARCCWNPDPRDYQAQLAQAEAAVTSARAQRNTAQQAIRSRASVITQQRAQAAAADATLAQAAAEERGAWPRPPTIFSTSSATPNYIRLTLYRASAMTQALTTARASTAQADAAHRRTQTTEAQAIQAQAVVNQARNDYSQSREQISVNDAQIKQAQAQADAANLQLSYAKLYASEAGRITSKAVDEGQTVSVGQQLLLITYGQLWVTANFKETQLTHMRVGQPVQLVVDTYPGEQFAGRVESFQRGTGSRFSLLPAENATGNYVKVVQRLPVKIVFDGQPDLHCRPLACRWPRRWTSPWPLPSRT